MSDKTAPQNKKAPPQKFENGERLPLVWERILCLILAALFGLWLAQNANQPLQKLLGFHPIFPFLPEDKGSVQLAILLMSLPVVFMLWLFRTWDTREHIQKAGESAEAARQSAETARQNVETARQSAEAARQSAKTAKQSEKTARENVETAQKSLAASALTRNINMLSSDDLRTRCFGLIQLAEIKRQGNFVEEIDIATQQNLDLFNANFHGQNLSGVNLEKANLANVVFSGETNLSGANLQYANLHNAKLNNAILKGAELKGASLDEADFMGADLENANLCDVNFIHAKNLEHANLMRAKYNDNTGFPEAFGWYSWEKKNKAKKMGMIYSP